MNQADRQAFGDLIREYQETTGFLMPEALRSYLVDLLSDRVRDTDLIRDNSFAERYLKLPKNPQAYRQFGDDCLFYVSLTPEHGQRRGISMDYYATLGISCYYSWTDHTGDLRGRQLGNWFYVLQKFCHGLLRNQTNLSMWP